MTNKLGELSYVNMKIGMLTIWNAACGMSIHAELVGKEWLRIGHKIKVFAPLSHPDSRPVAQEDEEYVVRTYRVSKIHPYTREDYFDKQPLLDYDMDIFFVENLERMPVLGLYQIFPEIKKKAKTVQLIHEGDPPHDPMFYKFDFDAIVCYDTRYKRWLVKYFPEEKIHIIPHPYHPWTPGDKAKAREELGLPQDKKIILTYGWRHHYVEPVLEPLNKLWNKYPIMFLVIASTSGDAGKIFELRSRFQFMEVRRESPGIERLYRYLHASDLLLFYREPLNYSSVLSSSVFLTMGSGCPILFSDINMVELHGDEILKFKTPDEMIEKIELVFDNKFDISIPRKVVESQSSRKVARKFIELFEKMLNSKL